MVALESGSGAPQENPEKKQPLEIERKFLVKSLPENIEDFPKKDIVQGYLAITPDGTEVRLRQKGDKFFQTVKSGGGKTRFESEIEITEEQFDSLWEATAGKRVEKTRYEIPHESGTIELDVYHGELDGLLSAEMEFKNENDSDKFVPPEWFDDEVTEDGKYKNQSLALHGAPKRKQPRLERSREDLGIPEFELDDGVEKIISAAQEKMDQEDRPIVIEIAGGSASGKTSAVADKVKKEFGSDALVISIDDYYRGKTFMEEEAEKGNELNWDQPEALNLELLKEHLAALKNGESIEKPVYDMKTSEPSGVKKLKPKDVIIVEGLFALHDQLQNEGDVKAFVDVGTHGRILRRLLRDIQRTGQKPADILKYFSEVVEPMHEQYIESTKKNSDLIINNEYSPEIEAERSGLHEVQLKFQGELDPDSLRSLGAEKLSATTQVDNYYNPDDRNLVETDEILRIRQEGKKRTLTYKGPKVESKFRERPKFEFEIDKATEEAFLGIYGDKKKTISKDRTLFQLDGVVFSIDKVSKTEDGKTTDLGNFIEIRSTDKDADEAKIQAVIEKLGLGSQEGIKESYFEM